VQAILRAAHRVLQEPPASGTKGAAGRTR